MRSRMRMFALLFTTLFVAACSNGNNNNNNRDPEFDFATLDAAMQAFIDNHGVFDGISITLVDRELGTVHEAAFGDHTLDIVVQLASTSKVPSVTLLMALDGDDSLDYDVEATIDNYLPWDGVYGDRTSVHLVSNTSGIPGLAGIPNYGDHICQFSGFVTLQECAEVLYTVLVPGTVPPGTIFDYGGTQWQLAGAVAEHVNNSTWNQAFDEYIGGPCDLDVFTYGNMWLNLLDWTGSPDSLTGQQNAHVEGGAITNMQDYAKLLLLHLREGQCGDNQVLTPAAVEFMQVDRAGPLGGPGYGMGWWIQEGDAENNEILYDPGAFGAISWMDVERGIGGYVGIDDYTRVAAADVYELVLGTIVALQQEAVDAAREAAAN